MNKKRFYYQPAGVSGFIDWCWILMCIFLLIILQYEICKFNWLVIILSLIYLLFLLWQILGRQVVINGEEFVIHKLLHRRDVMINVHQLKNVNFTKHVFSFIVSNEKYNLFLSKKSIVLIKKIINE